MKCLFVGDIVGKPGRRVLLHYLESVRKQHAIDFVVVNAENAAGGFGVTEKITRQLVDNGVHCLSNGNHAWDKKEALEFIDRYPALLRPHNYPEGTPGTGWRIYNAGSTRIGVLNLMGNVFMHPALECPFRLADKVLADKPDDVKVVIVDMHAEATSEKQAMGWHLDGRVSAVVGTHTHVPTADERLLPRGTAYISDIGMTGCYDSVIGMDRHISLKRFITKLAERYQVADGPASLCAVILDIDETTGRSRSITRLRLDESA